MDIRPSDYFYDDSFTGVKKMSPEEIMKQHLDLARAKVEKLEKENRMLRAQVHTLEHEVRSLRADLCGERMISAMIIEQLQEQEDEEDEDQARSEAFYAQRERDYRE